MKRSFVFVVLAAAFAVAVPLYAVSQGDKAFPAVSGEQAVGLATKLPEGVRTLDSKTVWEASREITREKYPDADDVLVDSVTCEVYEKDGRSVTFDDTCEKILTEKGRRSAATTPFYFNSFYSDITIRVAEIIKADGRVIPVDLERNVKTMIDTDQMGSNIYDPAQKILLLSFPDLEIGDITRCAIVRRTFKTRVPNMWADYNLFQYTSPIKRYTYAVSAPKELPLRHVCLRDQVGETVRKSEKPLADGRTLHVWDVQDVPQVFPEPSMPPLHTVVQRLILSTAEDWPALSRWYWNLCKPRLAAVTPEMEKFVKGLIAGAKDDEERIHRIFTFVSQEIRYMGVTTETEAPGYEPHDISMTFENRYGVCRDKAALVVGLLRLAGLEAYPVLIHAENKLDPEVPMTFFNHAIACVRRPDGTYQLMDPTNENSRDYLPSYLDDKSYLVAHPKGEKLRLSPIVPSKDNLLKVETKAKVGADGKLSFDSTIRFEGINDVVYRGFFASIPAEQRRHFFDGLLKHRLAGGKVERYELSPADVRNTEEPLVVRLSVTVPDYPVQDSDFLLLDLPWLSESIGYVNFLIGNTGLEKRRFPLETETACGVSEMIDLRFEDGVASRAEVLPDHVSFSKEGVSYDLSVMGNGNGLQARRRFSLDQVTFEPAAYAALKNSLKEIEHAGRQRAIFRCADDAVDADKRTLSTRLDFEYVSPHSYTSTLSKTTEILTYAGKKDNSEVILAYHPSIETLTLNEASVSNTVSGEVRCAEPHEINIMDAPWVASAPRYPAGKTMVVSLPGVETGSVLRVSYTRCSTNAFLPGGNFVFTDYDPVDEAVVELHGPAGLAPTIREHFLSSDDMASRAGVTNTCDKDNRRFSKTWRKARPARIPREESLPGYYAFAPTVSFSAGDWSDYGRFIADAVKGAVAPGVSSKTRALARELTAQAKTEREKLVAIRDYVAKNIRLAGPSFTTLAKPVSDVDVTLTDGYGHSLDRAVVLYAMIDAVGLKPSLVLADGGKPLDVADSPRYKVPSKGVFTDPLVLVFLDGKTPVYLNDTDQYAELGTTAHDGHWALPVLGHGLAPISVRNEENGKDFSFGLVKADDSHRNGLVSEVRMELDEEGNAIFRVEQKGRGILSAAFRKSFREMTPELLRRQHLEMVNELSRAAVPDGPLNLSLDQDPATLSFHAEVPRFAVRSGDTLTLLLGGEAPLVRLRSDKRTMPLRIGEGVPTEEHLEVVLPAETEKILMKPSSFDFGLSSFGMGDYSRMVSTSRREDGRLVLSVRTSRKIKGAVLKAACYPAILEMNRQLNHPRIETVVIRLKR